MWFLGDAMSSCSPFVVMALRNWEHAKFAHQHMLVSEVKHAQKEDLAFQLIIQTQWHRVVVAFYSKHDYVDIMTYSYAYLNVFDFFVQTLFSFPFSRISKVKFHPKHPGPSSLRFTRRPAIFVQKSGRLIHQPPGFRWSLWNKTALWVGLKSFSGGLVQRYNLTRWPRFQV